MQQESLLKNKAITEENRKQREREREREDESQILEDIPGTFWKPDSYFDYFSSINKSVSLFPLLLFNWS